MSILDFIEPGIKSRDWIRDHMDYPNRDYCLMWPFGRDTNGYAHVGKAHHSVHRLMCWHRNGLPPEPHYHAAHSCGNGHLGCVNPQHLDWKTPRDNQLDRYKHSGLTPRRKLTPEQVDEIRALKGRASLSDIAGRFGVTPSNIAHIHAGRVWAGNFQNRVFSPEEVRLIRATPWQQKSARQWAEEFGVKRSVIDRIRTNKTYRYVDEVAA